MDDPITTAFSPLIALPCWGVAKVHGSILSFEFGEPHLYVREPIISTSASPTVREAMGRRRVKPVGTCHLSVCKCRWQFLSRGEAVAHGEASDDLIEAAVREVDGQKLMGVTLNSLERTTAFHFDLGGPLATSPYEAGHDHQWSLYLPDERVLTYRADGCYSLGPSSLRPSELVWQVLPRTPQDYCVGFGP